MKFEVSAKAKEKLMELFENNKPIKMKITGHSWCGATIGIVSEKQNENEKTYKFDNIDIIISEDLEGAIKGANIEYIEGWLKKGFEVTPIMS